MVLYDVKTPLTLINMANTYYKVTNTNTKVYLRDNVKDHAIFRKKSFWETALLSKIEDCHQSFNFKRGDVDKEILSSNYQSQLSNVFLGVAFTMKNFEFDQTLSLRLLDTYYRELTLPVKKFGNIVKLLN